MRVTAPPAAVVPVKGPVLSQYGAVHGCLEHALLPLSPILVLQPATPHGNPGLLQQLLQTPVSRWTARQLPLVAHTCMASMPSVQARRGPRVPLVGMPEGLHANTHAWDTPYCMRRAYTLWAHMHGICCSSGRGV